MRAGTMEPMIEIFLEETSVLLSELKDCAEKGRDTGKLDHEQINEMFRNIHTLKADAIMMLYDTIAVPAKELEQVLSELRGQPDDMDEVGADEFLTLMEENISFYEGEVQKLTDGGRADGDHEKLLEHIRAYMQRIGADEPVKKTLAMESLEEDESFFYISSNDDSGKKEIKQREYREETKEQEVFALPETEKRQVHFKEDYSYVPDNSLLKRPKHILVSSEELDHLDTINVRLLRLANNAGTEIQVLLRELDSWLWRIHSTDFTMVAAKLDMAVKNIVEHLDKQVSFHVTGSRTTIEKSKIDKISNALLHLVRNAVDHGIEMPQERKACGKTKCGYVNVEIEEVDERAGIRIRVSDDGRGLDKWKILSKAQQMGMLVKPLQDYTEEEAFELIFQPGFTTAENAGDYSGRGVGMDVVKHSLREIGGTIQIESVLGVGTSFLLDITYDSSINGDDGSKRRALIDESIISRR